MTDHEIRVRLLKIFRHVREIVQRRGGEVTDEDVVKAVRSMPNGRHLYQEAARRGLLYRAIGGDQ